MTFKRIPHFTNREMDVLRLMHKPTNEISTNLSLEASSVLCHLDKIQSKLAARTRLEALLVAINIKLVEFPAMCTGEKRDLPLLTASQRQVLSRLHLRNKTIAEKLNMKLRNVEAHVAQILRVLGAQDRMSAMLKALTLGAITMPNLGQRLRESPEAEQEERFPSEAESLMQSQTGDYDSLGERCDHIGLTILEKYVLLLLFAATEIENTYRMRTISEMAASQGREKADILLDLDCVYSIIKENGYTLPGFVFGEKAPLVIINGKDEAIAEMKQLRAELQDQDTRGNKSQATNGLRWTTTTPRSAQATPSPSRTTQEPRVTSAPEPWKPAALPSFVKPTPLNEGNENVKHNTHTPQAKCTQQETLEESSMPKYSKRQTSAKKQSTTQKGHPNPEEMLSQRQKEVVLAMFAPDGKELTNKEIAKLLGTTEGNVSYAKSMGKAKLKREYNLTPRAFAEKVQALRAQKVETPKDSAPVSTPEDANASPAASSSATSTTSQAEDKGTSNLQTGQAVTEAEPESLIDEENKVTANATETDATEPDAPAQDDSNSPAEATDEAQAESSEEETTETLASETPASSAAPAPETTPETQADAESEPDQPAGKETMTVDLADIFGDDMSEDEAEKAMKLMQSLFGPRESKSGGADASLGQLLSVTEELLEAHQKQLQSQAALTNAIKLFLSSLRQKLG